jgi:hypothetical protein
VVDWANRLSMDHVPLLNTLALTDYRPAAQASKIGAQHLVLFVSWCHLFHLLLRFPSEKKDAPSISDEPRFRGLANARHELLYVLLPNALESSYCARSCNWSGGTSCAYRLVPLVPLVSPLSVRVSLQLSVQPSSSPLLRRLDIA